MLVLGEQVVQDPKKDEINQLIYKKILLLKVEELIRLSEVEADNK